MEGPLLSKSERNDVTIHGDSSTSDEHVVDITVNDDSSSADEKTPHEGVQSSRTDIDAVVWTLVGFVVALLQIVAAIAVLTLTKDEQQPSPKILVTLIIAYTCGCILTLPILGWRFWFYNQSVSSETRINEVMNSLRMMLGYFFVGWITVFIWHLVNNSSSIDYSAPHFWLCLAFFANSCIQHVFRNLHCSVICFVFPLLPRFAEVVDFIGDIDEKLTIIGLVFIACVGILTCICKCRSQT
ncbi:hypothetical protein CARUB_v10012152mg [Capsella rubella]|uniref:Transmembrane protein n=1 Tax=Capsella rubella TaxID=81985 RepID=R0IKV3_9BRAS|nr:uncharacterized protein LOC17900217 [Capsella rubella]EOA39185.1 hypothetical protein CARUB_v10012152mg [Capsella rubella]